MRLQVTTLTVRSPECVFPPGKFAQYSFAVDLWALACNAHLLLFRENLFSLTKTSTSYDLAGQMMQKLGPLPDHLVATKSWVPPALASGASRPVQQLFPLSSPNLRKEDCLFLCDCLSYDPAARPSLSKHKFPTTAA